MKSKIDLRSMRSEPFENPLITPTTVRVKNKITKTASSKRSLLDPETGEIRAISAIYTIEEQDDEHFVKVFAGGVKAAFGLNRTAARVFQAVLAAYQNEKMTGGFTDSVMLGWFGDGLNDEDIGMTDRTFFNGLKILIECKFLYPKTPNIYWVNPALFFKGDRVAFIREYRRKSSGRTLQIKVDKNRQLPFDEETK